jgi:hypothetical protein
VHYIRKRKSLGVLPDHHVDALNGVYLSGRLKKTNNSLRNGLPNSRNINELVTVDHCSISRIVAIRKLLLSTRLFFRSEMKQGSAFCVILHSPFPRAQCDHRKHSSLLTG